MTENKTTGPAKRGSIDLEIDFLNLMPGTYYAGVEVRVCTISTTRAKTSSRLIGSRQTTMALAGGLRSVSVWFFPTRWARPVQRHRVQ